MVLQVIDWLNNHGDIFLQKNTTVGKSLNRAKTLQKSHEHFEAVAQVNILLFFLGGGIKKNTIRNMFLSGIFLEFLQMSMEK